MENEIRLVLIDEKSPNLGLSSATNGGYIGATSRTKIARHGRRQSAMSALLKAPAFRQYCGCLQDSAFSMSREDLVDVLRASLVSAASHSFSSYIEDQLEQCGHWTTRRYFPVDRDVIMTSSGEDSPDYVVINHLLRGVRAPSRQRPFRMPTFAEFLAETATERRRKRSLWPEVSQGRSTKGPPTTNQSTNVVGENLSGLTESDDHRQARSSTSPAPPDVANEEDNGRDSDEYDPSIWDFLPSAPEEEEEEEEQKQEQDDEEEDEKMEPDSQDVGYRCAEHAQAVREIVVTEISYSNDLAIIKSEFYDALKSNSLLNEDQLQAVFLNLPELIVVSNYFTKRLQTAIGTDKHGELADHKSLIEALVGRAFLDSTHMLLAFETYCVNQCSSALVIDQLTQERDVLRVFLDQLQKERPSLRKMDLKAFLMVPVQRVTKLNEPKFTNCREEMERLLSYKGVPDERDVSTYPLLLDRVLKLMPVAHPDRDDMILARRYVEETLSVINAKAIGSLKMKRRTAAALWPKKNLALENIEVTQFAVDQLRWNRSETHFLFVGRVFYSTQLSNFRSVRDPVHCVIATLGLMSPSETGSSVPRHLLFPRSNTLRSAAVIIVKKDRSGKYTPAQDPIMLDKCVISAEAGPSPVVELHEMYRDSCFLKMDIAGDTEAWLRQLKLLALSLGSWRRRRCALSNVMTQT